MKWNCRNEIIALFIALSFPTILAVGSILFAEILWGSLIARLSVLILIGIVLYLLFYSFRHKSRRTKNSGEKHNNDQIGAGDSNR